MTMTSLLSFQYKICRSKKFIYNFITTSRSISVSMNHCGLFKDSGHSQLYSKYRPTYPPELYDNIISYCKETRNVLKCALDVGCGSGQSCVPLKTHFEKVIGIDVSQSQIDQANALKNNGITYKVGSGEDLSFLGNSSIDLVTVAQALHWIDTEKFYAEVCRILTPGGALVVYGYGTCSIDIQEAQNHFWKFYKETLNGYWDPRRRHIDNMMADFELPFPEWKRNDSLYFEKIWSLEDFIGYVSSWSAWQQYLKVNPGSKELDELHSKLKVLYHSTDEEKKVKVHFPCFMLMGKKPLDNV